MNQRSIKSLLLFLALALIMAAGCKKKTPPPVAPPPPPAAAPTASISANPASVEKGGSVQLTWQTENATDVTITGLGKVEASGSRSVSPAESTNYVLTATGDGGSKSATARVTVSEPAPVQQEQPVSQSDEQWFASNVKDIYFDYDSAEVRADQQQTIRANAAALAQRANFKFTIEGHADERGSTEYNLTLADERANAVKNALVAAGVNASRINVISYGKEKPFCTESTESCWQENRRGHFVLTNK